MPQKWDSKGLLVGGTIFNSRIKTLPLDILIVHKGMMDSNHNLQVKVKEYEAFV
jgi:hypothetical protein